MDSCNLKSLWGLFGLFLFHFPLLSGQTIYGTITTEEAEGIEGVTVSISCSSVYTTITDASGSYIFENIPEGETCSMGVFLNDNWHNGVSVFDMIIISKHILAVQLLDSPYKMIAADINNNGQISESDLLELMAFNYGDIDEFPNNTSWRFIPADYVFPDPTNPWLEEFPETINIDGVTGDVEVNYIGIKIGDVNGSVSPN
jgi:hypothetical protein